MPHQTSDYRLFTKFLQHVGIASLTLYQRVTLHTKKVLHLAFDSSRFFNHKAWWFGLVIFYRNLDYEIQKNAGFVFFFTPKMILDIFVTHWLKVFQKQ